MADESEKKSVGSFNLVEIELEILDFWKKNSIYKKIKDKGKGKKDYYFLDGPPYTSGRVHIGTAWNKSLKDMVLRYKRMKGFNVWDRAGYDMHGLPTELKVQKKLNITDKEDIPKFGVGKFIQECQDFSVENMNKMNEDFSRLGVWMDFENAYQSIKPEFIESCWWLIKQAEKNDRLYEGEKVMHWCAECATSLAKHELEYETDTDDSVFLKFKVKGKENEFLIIWTTTPWTIPFNLGVMVNPELEYVKAKVENEVWILAKGLAGVMIGGVAGKNFEILEEMHGDKLEGIEYIHPLNDESEIYEKLKKKHPKVCTVLLSEEYVSLGAGSGIVHMAPGCGPEDYEVGRKNNIPPFNNLDEKGAFPSEWKSFIGWIAKKDDKKFIELFDKKGILIASTKVEHEYAHCWRCKSPVVFKTTKQWFFKVEDLKEKMRELNKKIFWVPDWAGSKWFDSWLDNLRDNGITRQRYWGTPLPIWKCDNCKEHLVIGSVKELKKYAKKVPDDLHKPFIDEVTFKCKECNEGTMTRIPDILDVWIDAGTTSWSCLDYPKREDNFKKLWPADFIMEGKDQIRGWFNLLFVASMVGMELPSYKAVYMHGFVQDSQGRKMSKSLGNIISPEEVINKYGADTFRFYTIGAANPGLDLIYNIEDVKVKNKNLSILWNISKLLIDMANNNRISPDELEYGDVKANLGFEEKYMLSKLHSTICTVSDLMERYELSQVPGKIEELFLDLSRTYIQMIRDKASEGTIEEKKAVVYVVYNAMMEILKMASIVTPFLSEKIYQVFKEQFKLKNASLHMYEWPVADKKLINADLETKFSQIKGILQGILFCREKANLGVRWPVKEVLMVSKSEELKKAAIDLQEIIKTQTNVKEFKVVDFVDGVTEKIRADFNKFGPKFGDLTPRVVHKVVIESSGAVLNKLNKEGVYKFELDGKEMVIEKDDIKLERVVPDKYVFSDISGGELFLNKERTKLLDSEGFSREITRRVQSMRKDLGLSKNDRIQLYIVSNHEGVHVLEEWKDKISQKVGALAFELSPNKPKESYDLNGVEKIKDKSFEIFIKKI